MEYTTLGDITLKTEIHYDPDPRTTVVPDDLEFVEEYFQVDTDEVNPDHMSPWVLRVVLDPRGFTVKKLSMANLAARITDHYKHQVHVVYTDDNSTNLILRIRILVAEEERGGEGEDTALGSEDHDLLRRMQKNLLNNLHLCGIPGIKKVRSDLVMYCCSVVVTYVYCMYICSISIWY